MSIINNSSCLTSMPLPQYRIVSEATLEQCVLWIAHDQTPLSDDDEWHRVQKTEIAYQNVHDSPDTNRAKHLLLEKLATGALVAVGCEGEYLISEQGRAISDIQNIDHTSWRYELSERNWKFSSIGHPVKSSDHYYSYVRVPTVDLFNAFSHEDMPSKLAGHENGNYFLEKLSLNSVEVNSPRQSGRNDTEGVEDQDAQASPSDQTDVQVNKVKTLAEFHSERVEHFMNIHNCGRPKAAALASLDPPDPCGPNKKKYQPTYIERNDRKWRAAKWTK
jgi:hypothetical protein